MPTIFKILFLVGGLLLNFLAQAQGLRNNPDLQARLSQAKLLEIQKGLNLSAAKMEDFSPIFMRYQAELNQINFARQGRLMRINPDSLSTAEADKIITTQLDNAVKISSLRKKYYPEFKTVLTPQQVMRLYHSEAQIHRQVMLEFRKRFGNRPR